jgi:hypothetical protein
MKRNKARKGSAPTRREPDIIWFEGQYHHGLSCECETPDCRFYRTIMHDFGTQEDR